MIIAFDPGKNIGVAFVSMQGELYSSATLNLEQVTTLDIPPHSTLVLGNGTGHKPILSILEKRNLNAILVNETGSSLEARHHYWQYYKPTGWQRFLPKDLRTIRQLDGMAAYVIALRWLAGHDQPTC